MNNKKYLILFIGTILFLAIISICIAVFSNSKKDNATKKIEEEISYLEMKLIGMLNALNNIPMSSSVMLEQSSVKSNQNNEQGGNTQDSLGGSSEKSSSDNNSSDSSTGKSNNQNKESESYNKYSIENENILIETNDKIDWNYMKNTAEKLYTSWTSIMIDLHSINIKNEDVLDFSDNLNTLILNIENENKLLTLNNLAVLYAYIPVYMSQYSENKDRINIAYVKSYIINSYILTEEDKWDEMQTQIDNAQQYFGTVMNSINKDKMQNSVNKTYILLNEMKNVISLKDKKLYFIKYKNLMENIMTI